MTTQVLLQFSVPNVFSFSMCKSPDIDVELSKHMNWFENQKGFLNKAARCESGIDVKAYLCSDLSPFVESFEQVLREYLGRYIIYCTFKFHNIDEDKIITIRQSMFEAAQQAFERLSPSRKTSEMWWYYGCLLWRRALTMSEFNMTLINKTVNCIVNIDSERHRKGLLCFIIVTYYPNCVEYPDYEPLRTLQEAFSDWNCKYDGFCARLRHEFIRGRIVNNKYFEFEPNSPLLRKHSKKKSFTINIPATSSAFQGLFIEITADCLYMYVFAAHLAPPSCPMIMIRSPELKQFGKTRQFSTYLNDQLRTTRFCNGEGFLNVEKVERDFDIFQTIVVESLVQFYKAQKICDYNNNAEKRRILEQVKPSFTKEKIISQLRKLEDIQTKLSTFNGLRAVCLFRESLLPHIYGLEPTLLQSVLHAVDECTQLLHRSRTIFDSKAEDFKKADQWFDLAKSVVASLKQQPRHLLIQVGTPIEINKNSSNHALYVCLKYFPKRETVQIIVTNGGTKVERFHLPHPQQDERDRLQYRYAAFEHFRLEDCEVQLSHYLYALLKLEYRKSISADKTHPDTYENLLNCVYLGTVDMRLKTIQKSDTFAGYGYQKIIAFKRHDLNDTFLSQFTSNCTIHNLKYSLRILFDMDEITFGLLEDTLFMGFDQLLSKFLL